MKAFGLISLLCIVAVTQARKQIGCKVAAYCDYADGTSKQEYRPFPTQRQANMWAKNTGPEKPVVLTMSGDCSDPGWYNGLDGYQYKILNAKADWISARDICRSKGADLAYNGIKDPKNFEFMRDSFLKQGNYEGYWIGLSDRENEGEWRWIDGEKLTSDQASWQSGQPDNNGGNQNCGYISRSYDYKWDDGDCSAMLQVMCERRL